MLASQLARCGQQVQFTPAAAATACGSAGRRVGELLGSSTALVVCHIVVHVQAPVSHAAARHAAL